VKTAGCRAYGLTGMNGKDGCFRVVSSGCFRKLIDIFYCQGGCGKGDDQTDSEKDGCFFPELVFRVWVIRWCHAEVSGVLIRAAEQACIYSGINLKLAQ
jgi:hypothetical protein